MFDNKGTSLNSSNSSENSKERKSNSQSESETLKVSQESEEKEEVKLSLKLSLKDLEVLVEERLERKSKAKKEAKIKAKKDSEIEALKTNVWNISVHPFSNGAKLATLIVIFVFTTYSIFFKKSKEKKNLSIHEEIETKFAEWRNNIYFSIFFYISFFFLFKDGINFFIKPLIKGYLEKDENLTILFISFVMGILFILDGIIILLIIIYSLFK